MKGYKIKLLRLFEHSKTITGGVIIETFNKDHLNYLLDKIIAFTKNLNNHFIYDYKKVQDFKEESFYQFTDDLSTMVLHVLVPQDFLVASSSVGCEEHIEVQIEFYYINNFLIIYSSCENSFVENTFVDKLNFNFYRGTIEKALLINAGEPSTDKQKKQKKQQNSFSGLELRESSKMSNMINDDIKMANRNLKKQMTCKHSRSTKNIVKMVPSLSESSEELACNDDSDISSETDIEWNMFKKGTTIVGSINNHYIGKQRRQAILQIEANIQQSINLELFYYYILLNMLIPLEMKLKEIYKTIKNLEWKFFSDQITTKLEFASIISEIDEKILNVKQQISIKNCFLTNTNFNFSTLSLEKWSSTNPKAKIFCSRMEVFIKHLQTKCQELEYFVFNLNYSSTILKDHYKTYLVSNEYQYNIDFFKIMWKLTLVTSLTLLFNLLANFIGVNIMTPFKKFQSDSLLMFWIIVIIGLIVSVMQFFTFTKSSLFKEAFR